MPVQKANTGDTVVYRKTNGKRENSLIRQGQPSAPSTSTVVQVAGGTLAATGYSYRITQLVNSVESNVSSAVSITTTGASGAVRVSLPGQVGVIYKVYGRLPSSQLYMHTSAVAATAFTDTGSVTPSGAAPTADGRATIYLQSSRIVVTGGVPGRTPGTYDLRYSNPAS